VPHVTGTASEQPGTTFRSATGSDAASVAALVDAAYGHYVDRIGMQPGPMTDDYAEVIRDRHGSRAGRSGAASWSARCGRCR
jgi:hypothetical protein